MAATRYTNLALCRRLLVQARPYWLHLAGIFLISLLAVPLALLTPLPLRIAVDSVIGSHPIPGFLQQLLPETAIYSKAGLLVLAAALGVVIALLVHLEALGS